MTVKKPFAALIAAAALFLSLGAGCENGGGEDGDGNPGVEQNDGDQGDEQDGEQDGDEQDGDN
ncbi:hypothetical protein ACFFSW_25210 [Saccharothrix longispora]|uniref:Uncharacterized protein n=1 Tax=Saccharothrix longispora TaxID=33920 RepID=A0ABU1PYE9_9PSEU|nr:hypothetical protein [Saccharothrix longispora]MDR6595179.1 hypothetical protein [Saccharothrix longispora]